MTRGAGRRLAGVAWSSATVAAAVGVAACATPAPTSPAPTPSPTLATSSPVETPQPPALVYEVGGTGTAAIAYVAAAGAQVQQTVQLPWSLTLTQAPAHAVLTAQHPSDASSFSCTITQAGNVAAHAEASGPSATVRCTVG